MTKYIIDLFSGCGGVTTGFQNAGYIPILAIDCWEKALGVHNDQHSKCKHISATIGTQKNCLDDVKLLECIFNAHKFRTNDTVHVHASPPCQQLSSINPSRTNNVNLTKWILSFFIEKLPAHWTWTIEQVAHPKVKSLYESTAKKNTKIFYQMLDMSEYGICQTRKRMIASNVNLFPALLKMKTQSYLRSTLKCPKNAKYVANGNFSYSKWENFSKAIAYKEIEKDTVCYTVVSTPSWFIDKDETPIRSFTLDENRQLQTFPKNYFQWAEKNCTKSELSQMIANSVPPAFARLLAVSIDKTKT